VVPKPLQECLRSRMWAAHHESTPCDIGRGKFGDAPRQRVEAPGIHAVCQHFLPIVSQAVALAFPCLPSTNQQAVIRFFQAQPPVVLVILRLKSQELPYLVTKAAHASTAWHSMLSAAHFSLTGQTSPSSGQITLAASVRPKYASTSAGVPFQRS